MQLQLATFLGLFAIHSLASSHVVHEKRDSRNLEWSALSRLDPDAILPLRIGLKQRNLDQGPLWLHQISHPASPDYGRHWNVTQVREMFKPAFVLDICVCPHPLTYETVMLQLKLCTTGFRKLVSTAIVINSRQV